MDTKETPVLLLTGYLGSGKTTLLNRILANEKGIRFAVIVNDIGEVNIDARLIQDGGVVGQGDDSLVALQNGCICCTLKMDLVKQLNDIINTRRFDYIVIEASGICEPAPIAQTISTYPKMIDAKLLKNGAARLDAIVTVVDALRMRDEFGLGDEIMFAQLAHMLKLQGTKKITLVAQKPIISLLQTHPDIDEVIIRENANAELTHFDYWVYPHAILAHVAMPFQLQPKRIPYLSAIPEKQPLFCKKIIKNDRLKVGVVWRGDPSHENDANRSIHDLGPIEKLFNSDNVDFYCLQKEQNEAEKDLLARYQVTDLSADLHDMADTAAAISLLDCIVTVDTSVAHVAGALNKPTLLMLSYVVDWRWGSYQRENLWYPNMESIRWRAMIEDWHYVIDEVKQALAKISASR